jgi:large subunit ribosomal protein L13
MTKEKKEIKHKTKEVVKKAKKVCGKNPMKTFLTRSSDIKRKWYIIDATDLVLGRMASVIASYLRGKHKPYFTPHLDCGDYIIVVNAEKVYLTGKKADNKLYYKHTRFPGGLQVRSAKEVFTSKFPERIVRNAVGNMTKTGKCIGRKVMKKLFIYSGSEHPHTAQNPEKLDIASMNNKNSKRN